MKKTLSILLLVVFMATLLPAQRSNIMYGSKRIPQNNALNPAFFPVRDRLYVSLPGANMNFSSPLSVNNIFTYDSVNQFTVVDLNKIVDTLANNGSIDLNADIYVAGVGLRFGHTFLTANVQAKTNFHLGIPQGLLTFLNEGNINHLGETMNILDGNLLSGQAYAEAAVGIGHEFGNLTIGARVKVLNGYADFRTTGTNLSLYTASDLSTMQANLSTQLAYSLPFANQGDSLDFSAFNMGNLLYLTDNWGYAFDLGASYKWGMFDFAASVLDLGPGLHWTQNVYNLSQAQSDGATITFSGIDLSGAISGGNVDTSIVNSLKDSLSAMTNFTRTDGEDYWTTIPTKFNASVSMELGRSLSAGILFHGEFDRNFTRLDDVGNAVRDSRFSSSTTLLANFNLADWVEIMGSVSVVDDGNKVDWFNPGFGVNVSLLHAIQAYMLVDYVSNLHLVEAKQFNIYFGLNLLLGHMDD